MQKIEKMTYPNKVAAKAQICEEYKKNAQYMTENIISEFLELCKIPHPSGHVEKMREYLMNWGLEHKIETHLDSSGCVYMDIPAEKNCENFPKIIFQAHYDMVAVAAVGNEDYDPVTSPIIPIIDEENSCIHTNWMTSLGADDGHGVATCLALANMHNDPNVHFEHGPIRLLFSYDEETTLKGVKLLNKEVLDSKYLINLDAISVGTIITSAAGGFAASAYRKFTPIISGAKTNILSLKIWGLSGGHSGSDINLGRGNTLAIFTEYLDKLLENSINFNFKNVECGILMNAIPSKISAEIVVGYHDIEKATDIAEDFLWECMKRYTDGANMQYSIKPKNTPENTEVLTISDSMKIYSYLKMLPMGVINTFENGEPKSSNNVGLLKIKDGVLYSEFLFRSVVQDVLNNAAETMTKTAVDTKIDFTIECIFPLWPKVENNPVNNVILESYKNACGFEGDTLDIHAGLETGYLSCKKPDLIMASIGCDICNEHTRKETFFTDSLPAYCASILYTLKNIK